MKSLLITLFLLNFNVHNNDSYRKNSLDGIWRPVALEIAGSPLPDESFAKQQLTISDSTYTFIAESIDKGVLSYKDGKMDIYGRDGVNAGKHFMTIYKLEKAEGKTEIGKDKRSTSARATVDREKLTICYNLNGDKYPEDFSTKGQPNYFMAVFVRADK